ncbi:MAG TPA: hypothetical protein VNL71_00985 [Chloroflexota bacterium]|nr:hypothetical protein [Chloroflexota bacterium]
MSQSQPLVEIYSRSGDLWVYREYGPGEIVQLVSIDLALPIEVMYEDVEWGSRTS